MKKLITIAVILYFTGHLHAQIMPSLLDSIHTGYRDIVRINPDYIAAIRNSTLDIRHAAPNTLGTVSASDIISDLPAMGGHVEVNNNFVYTIYSKITPVNITNPLVPTPVAPVNLPAPAMSTCIWNDLLVVGCSNSRSYVYSLVTPGIPVLVDSIEMPLQTIKFKGNRLYVLSALESKVFCLKIATTLPSLTLTDSFDLYSDPNSIDVVNNQLLAKTMDTLYRFDLNADLNFHLLSAERIPDYPGNGMLAAIDTNYIGYYKYNNFVLSYGVTGNSYIDSFMLGLGNYYLGSRKLDNNIFYGDVVSTRLIGLDNTTGIAREHINNIGLEVFPNPVIDRLHINIQDSKRNILILEDVSGAVIRKMTFSGTSTSINVGKLPPGIYFLRLQNEKQQLAVKKIIKQ